MDRVRHAGPLRIVSSWTWSAERTLPDSLLTVAFLALLRAIEEQSVLPVGATEPVKVDTRIIATTLVDLDQAVREGRFREDLFYRLSVVTIEIPPLRERTEDIPALVDAFIAALNRKLRRNILGVTNETLRRLLRYEWKGNVRELQNVIERAMILEEGDLITPATLPSNLLQRTHPAEKAEPLKEAVREFEREYINRILKATNGDKQLTAELLGVSVSSIYRRLQAFEEEVARLRDTTDWPNFRTRGSTACGSDWPGGDMWRFILSAIAASYRSTAAGRLLAVRGITIHSQHGRRN